MLRDLVKNLREAQRQLEAARAERDVRWQKLQTQLRSDAARHAAPAREGGGAAAPESASRAPAEERTRATV